MVFIRDLIIRDPGYFLGGVRGTGVGWLTGHNPGSFFLDLPLATMRMEKVPTTFSFFGEIHGDESGIFYTSQVAQDFFHSIGPFQETWICLEKVTQKPPDDIHHGIEKPVHKKHLKIQV